MYIKQEKRLPNFFQHLYWNSFKRKKTHYKIVIIDMILTMLE